MEDLDLLQGRWLQVGYERDGVVEPIDGERNWQPQTEISGEKFTVTLSDGSVILGGVFKLFPLRSPKGVDWTDTHGSYASDQMIPAIYELTATSFIFCAAYDGAARPTEFSTQPGQVLRKMRRL
jgi:uncharacterized protein (TIGR03067 family)